MDISFNNVLPLPLQQFVTADSLWKHDRNFTQGRHYQIIAPSGKGKSTLTGLLGGWRGDYTGDVIVQGRKLRDFTRNDWAQWRGLTCSFVHQDLKLFPALTMKENILLPQELTGHSASSVSEELSQWAQRLSISEKWDTPVRELSFGQMQRVALLRALNRSFEWIILDEPFSHLDQDNMTASLTLLLEVAQKNNAGIILTALDERFRLETFEQCII